MTRGDAELLVAGTSFDLFLALVRAVPGLVSVDELMRRVWPDVIVGKDTVSQGVRKLDDLRAVHVNPTAGGP